MPDWYYSIEGARSGPYSDDEMQRFAASGRFDAATLFWNAAFGDSWKPAADTPFRIAPPLTSPPPLPAAPPPQKGNGRVAWIAVAGCVAGLGVLLVALQLFRGAPTPAQVTVESRSLITVASGALLMTSRKITEASVIVDRSAMRA